MCITLTGSAGAVIRVRCFAQSVTLEFVLWPWTPFLSRTSRIRRRRAQDVADTTDSLRAVACIRFVRPCSWMLAAHGRESGLRDLVRRGATLGSHNPSRLATMYPGYSVNRR
jgi:hypothetical protein